jgi:arginine:agmatine antiporter
LTAEAHAGPPSHSGRIGVLGATALVMGAMIGSGVYLLPATLGAVGSISILGWLAATAAALAVAGVFAWLGPLVPQASGLAGYVQAGLGRFAGVQTTLAYWCSCWFGSVAIALAVAGYAAYLVPALAGPGPRLATTLAALWFGILASWIGPRIVARVEGWTLALGLVPVLLAAVLGWFWFDPEVFRASWNPQSLSVAAAIHDSGLNAFWAFLGLEGAAAVATVVRNPARDVPRATVLGVVGAAVVYIAACVALMGLLPAAQLSASTAPFADAARVALGLGGGAIIAVCALARTTGCVTAWILLSAETTRGAADEGAFLRRFASRDGRMPAVNLLVIGVLMTIATVATVSPTLGEQFGILINVAALLSLYAYILAGASLIRLARGLDSGKRIAAMLTGALAIACALGLVSTAKPIELLYSLIPLVLGAALYLALRRR